MPVLSPHLALGAHARRQGGGATVDRLSDETDGILLNFIATDSAKRVRSKSAGVVTESDALGFLTVGNLIYPPRVRDASNNRVWSPHNLYRNSNAPATQSRTVIVGQDYTVSVVGSGSLTLSNAGTGEVTEGNPITFTATTTSLTSTLTGSLTGMQLNRGAVPTAYVVAGASADAFGPPISWDEENGEWVLLIEPTRTQKLLNSAAPATQTRSLTAATYTLWIEGSGSVELSGGPTGTATEGSPVTFVVGSTTDVTFTVVGDVTFFQCEAGAVPTSQIISYGAEVVRSGGDVSLTTASLGISTEFSVYVDYYYPATSTGHVIIFRSTAGTSSIGFDNSSNTVVTRVNDTSVIQAQFSNGSVAQTAGARVQISGSFKANRFFSSLNNAHVGTGQGQDVAGTMPAIDNIFFGSVSGNAGHATAPLRIRRVVIVPNAKDAFDVTSWKQDITTDPTAYDVHLWIGQSNTNSGAGYDAGIDVGDASVDQISQSRVVAQAAEPLPSTITFGSNRIGPALAFARDYYVPERLAPGRKVLIVHCGASGTGFTDNRWNPDNDLYNNAVGLLSYALKKFPNARVTGIFSSAGENEAEAGWTESQFADAYDAQFTAIRAHVGNVPVVVGGMVKSWVEEVGETQRLDVRLAIADTPNRLANSGYASAEVPTELPADPALEKVHFGAAGQRIRSGRYWAAYEPLTVAA
jgi:hypothetical protein